jgi:hypothetical protein
MNSSAFCVLYGVWGLGYALAGTKSRTETGFDFMDMAQCGVVMGGYYPPESRNPALE